MGTIIADAGEFNAADFSTTETEDSGGRCQGEREEVWKLAQDEASAENEVEGKGEERDGSIKPRVRLVGIKFDKDGKKVREAFCGNFCTDRDDLKSAATRAKLDIWALGPLAIGIAVQAFEKWAGVERLEKRNAKDFPGAAERLRLVSFQAAKRVPIAKGSASRSDTRAKLSERFSFESRAWKNIHKLWSDFPSSLGFLTGETAGRRSAIGKRSTSLGSDLAK